MTNQHKPLPTLYKAIVIALGSVAFLACVGYCIWLPDLLKDELLHPTKSILPELLWSVFLYLYLPVVIYCFIVGELSNNLSQIDKLWSIIPCVFTWYITLYDAKFDVGKLRPKLILMSSLVTLWSCKLTYGFYLRGGYSIYFWAGEEDYRWVYVRDRLPVLKNNRVLMMIFNLCFVSIYQLLLIFAFSGGVTVGAIMTRHRCLSGTETTVIFGLSTTDLVVGFCMFCFIALETIADIQQQVFQKEKYRRIREKEDLYCPNEHYEIGFRTSSLFAYSRHPNHACEQAIWISFYLFTVDFNALKLFEVGGVINVSMTGLVLLMVIFTQSTALGEEISAGKYPLYSEYQQNVACIIDVGNVFRKLLKCKPPSRDWIKKLKNK